VLDVPLLRALHRDLDRAAAVWPERSFLRRFRAPSWAIARQEAERVLADLVLVRGAYAHALCLADGITRVAMLPAAPVPTVAAPAARTGRIRRGPRRRGLNLTLVVPASGEPAISTSPHLPGVALDAASRRDHLPGDLRDLRADRTSAVASLAMASVTVSVVLRRERIHQRSRQRRRAGRSPRWPRWYRLLC
jgi:hypothetical protein